MSARVINRPRRRRRARMLAVAALVGLGVAACSAGPGPNLPVRPANPTTPAAAPAAPSTCTDNAQTVASYRPEGPLPPPDALPAGSAMAAIRARGHLNVAVSADTLLFSFRNPLNGQLEGFDVEMAKLVAAAIFGTADGHISYKVVNYAQRIPSLQDGSVDLVADVMTINCSRWEQINFSTEYYRAGQRVLVDAQAAKTIRRIEDFENGQHGSVCVAAGSTNLDQLKSKFPSITRTVVPDVSDCMVLFQQGRVAAVTGDDTVLAGFAAQDPYARVVGPKFTQEPYGLGLPRENRNFSRQQAVDFTRFVNAVLQKARTDGTWKRLYKEQIKPPAGQPVPDPPPALYGRTPAP